MEVVLRDHNANKSRSRSSCVFGALMLVWFSLSDFALLEGIFPSDSVVQGWNIMGFPGIPHRSSPSDIFADDVGQVFFWAYDEHTDGFVSQSTLVPGKGYILWADEPVTIDGYGSKNYDDEVNVNLSYTDEMTWAGFNFASNPYNASIDWDWDGPSQGRVVGLSGHEADTHLLAFRRFEWFVSAEVRLGPGWGCWNSRLVPFRGELGARGTRSGEG